MTKERMKALVYEGARSLNIRDLPYPEHKDDEVVVQVNRVGICGSELSGYLGHNTLRVPPLVMGHEFCGVIDSVGANVNRFRVGDRVTANPLVSCNYCSDCRAGHPNLCVKRSLIGAGRPGAFAQYVTVPENNLYLLPDHVSDDEGVLTEPLACAIRICSLAQLNARDRLFIAGAGPIGLFTLLSAQLFGLEDIVVMDLNEKRLEIVKELGGIPVSNEVALNAILPVGGFHAAVDAVGMDVTRQNCMKVTRKGGRVVFSGLHAAESVLPVNLAIRNELSLLGSFGYNPVDFETALDWINSGKINIAPWIKHAPLEEGRECFELLLANPGKIAKIILSI